MQRILSQPRRVLVIVCNFNQEQEIETFLVKLLRHWPQADTVVVDDGSSDRSSEIAEKLGFAVLRQGKNQGIGAAIRRGIHEAKEKNFDAVTIMSANGKMQPEELSRVIAPVQNGEADYVTGSRFCLEGRSLDLPFFRRLAIKLYSLTASILLGRVFSDITCGFRCYKIDFLFEKSHRSIDQDWLDRYEMEYYIHYWACEKKLRIQEVPVSVVYSHLAPDRQSKIRLGRDALSIGLPFFLLRFRLRS